MLKWQNCGRAHQRLMEVMNLIFRKHPKLLEFLFCQDVPALRYDVRTLREEDSIWSSGEAVLLRVGLDLWCGEVEVKLWEIIQKLDQENYQNVLLGLQHLRPFDPDGSDIRWRQPKMAYSGWERSSSSSSSTT